MEFRSEPKGAIYPVHDYLQPVNRNAMLTRPPASLRRTYIFLLLIYFVTALHPSFAQSNKGIDSLKNDLKNAVADTNRVNTLNALSRKLREASQFVEAKKMAEEALSLGRKLDFKRGVIGAYNNLGSIYTNQGNYTEAVKNHMASIQVKEEIGDKRGMAVSYNIVAQLYENQGNYPEALKNLFASLKIREEIGDKKGTAGMYFNIGIVYGSRGNYSQAFRNYLVSLKIFEEVGDKAGIARCYSNIGGLYGAQGNLPEALKNSLAAMKIREEIGDKRQIANSYIIIGNIYKDESQGKYDEALEYYFKAIKLFEELNDKPSTIDVYFNIAFLYCGQCKYSESLKYHLVALKVSEETGNKNGVAASYGNIGDTYYRQSRAEAIPEQREQLLTKALNNYFICLEEMRKSNNEEGIANAYNHIGETYFALKNYSKARQFLKDDLALFLKLGKIDEIRESYLSLSRLDSATGDYQQAWVNYKLYTDYKDSSLNRANSQQLAQLREQYESDQKVKEIDQLKSDRQRLENEKQLYSLLLRTKQDSLDIAESEKQRVKLENEKIQALNLYNQQRIALLYSEKQIQQLQIEKDKADYAMKKAEADKKQEQLAVLNKEKTIQSLDLKKQRQTKNYFIAGLVLFTILSFFAYRNYRTRQRLKVQMLRNKIASDLHDDIGSTLSSISIFSQLALEESKEVRPMLQTIGDSSRKMLDAMADIVWTIKPENDQFEKIILRMRSFAYELLGAKKIEFRFVTDKNIADVKLSMEARRNLYLIFKEATNNMVKYAEASKAMFNIKEEHGKLMMLINDNGKGFDSNKETQGNGLKNMKKRAEEMGAVLRIDSLPGIGTTIKLELAV